MTAEDLVAMPSRPESEVEWEDLLLRLEVMPRALNVEIENAGGFCSPAAIADIIDRESVVNRYLERAAGATGGDMVPLPTTQVVANVVDTVDRFVRLRNRNFAMLQRRGINVWDWTVEVEPALTVTIYQLLSLLARRDVELLARLRSERLPARPAC